MKALGFQLLTGHIRYAVLDGNRGAPTLVNKGRLVVPRFNSVPELMDWYETNFDDLLATHDAKRVAYRLTLGPDKSQLFHIIFPYGVLNLQCYKREIPCNEFTSRAFVPSKLGLPRNSDLYAHCDTVFGQHPPYWDEQQKHAILAAWFVLPT
jgi:hypothetical protein